MLLRTLFQKVSQAGLDVLFPPRCVSCHRPESWLCHNCVTEISFITAPICQRCGLPLASSASSSCARCRMHPLRHLQGVRVAAYYENSPIEPAIHALKYYNHKAIAAILGQTLSEAYQRYQLRADVVAPVPLHPARYHERGYNQSELLAQELTLRLNISLDTTSLQRHKRTSSQVKLSAAERQQNVAGAFSCRGQAFAGQQVLLVDDVYTTGATMDACAAVLLQAGGAAAVWGLALARPVL